MGTLTWPDKSKRIKLDHIIIESALSPFGLANYKSGSPIVDFVGREKELNEFKQLIRLLHQERVSRAVRLEGPPGVGKSTLFNFVKETIEKERARAGKLSTPTTFLIQDLDILSTYFQVPDRISEFADIWKPMLEGLRAGFEPELGIDATLPEYIIFRLVFLLFKKDPTNLAEIIWSPDSRPIDLSTVKLKDIVQPLSKAGKKAVERLQTYYKEHRQEIRDLLQVTINQTQYTISRADNNTILNLFRVLDEDDPEDYLEKIRNADNQLFPRNDVLISFFKDLMRIYTCITRKQPLLLIGIDEAVKTSKEFQEEYYHDLGNLFVRLRNTLDYMLLVLISVTEDWVQFDKGINGFPELKRQIDRDFLYPIVLDQMSIDDVVKVFQNRMNRFWEAYPADRPIEASYYPFSDKLFEYAYRINKRDLREAIHCLDKLWIAFKNKLQIPKLETMFECMREVRQFLVRPLIPADFEPFEWKIIRSSFNNPSRFNSHTARSAAIEIGLENAWNCLKEHDKATPITNVLNNPTIRTLTSTTRRPDVLVVLHENLGAEFRRTVEFQVKMYGENAQVELKHIESSLELFREQYTDLIYFVITGKGLSPDAEAAIKNLETQYPIRIRRPSLTEMQEDRLYLLAIYEELTDKSLGAFEVDVPVVKNLLTDVLGQSVDAFLAEIKTLAYRQPKIQAYEEKTPPPPPKPPSQGSRLDDYGPKKDVKKETPPKIEDKTPDQPLTHKWLLKFPEFKDYRYELCALCKYLQDRESGPSKFKFVEATVLRNAIQGNAALNKDKFPDLIQLLQTHRYVQPEKRSLKLTKNGEELYKAIKDDNYRC